MTSLHEAMLDRDLFGKTFAGPTFAAWRTVAKVLEALPLDDDELALYQEITGRTVPPSQPFLEAYLIKPRRAGGTLFGAACGLHAALQDYTAKLGPGEVATCALIASDKRQARQLMGYVKGLVADSPIIRAELVKATEQEVEFAHRTRVEIHVASFRSTRGYSYACVLLDELAFYRSDFSASPDVELVRALRPGLANLGGRLLGFSSPHAKRGHLFEMHKAHFGRDGDRVLVIQAGGKTLNPTIDDAVIEAARAEDPVAARSEWDALFREDISQFLPDELIDRALRPGQKSLPYLPQHQYVAFCDPSGGRHDAMTLAVAHHEEGGRVCVDKLLAVAPPFDPQETVERFAETLSAYNLTTVTGDNYAPAWVESAFARHGVTYQRSALSASEIFVESLPLFVAGSVDLIDVPRLATELRLLERRPRPGGRGDIVSHPPRGTDDCANAATGALLLASALPVNAGRQPFAQAFAKTDYDPMSRWLDDEPPRVGVMRRSMTGL